MNKAESGRSMVELLGVLSIMGILSIGGIYSYGNASLRARATQVIEMAGELLSVARVKGEVDSDKVGRKATQFKGWAKIVGSQGEVVVCGCNDMNALKDRIKEMLGNGNVNDENDGHTVDCTDGSAKCFKMIFPENG